MPASRKYRRTDDMLASPLHAHPQYMAWKDIWQEQRDAVLGEDAIKERAQTYLPRMSAADAEDYKEFLSRAVFVNMSARTKNGLVGAIFRRAPDIVGIPDKVRDDLEHKFTDDGNDPAFAAKLIVDEIMETGRVGALVDRGNKPTDVPYVSIYRTENIVDWDYEKIEGRWTLTRVVLREGRQERSGEYSFFQHAILTSYRVLVLEAQADGTHIYRQHLYFKQGADASLEGAPDEVRTPINRGRTFDRIPFEFFGPFSGTAEIEKPPIRDIVTLNLAHYRDYAQLQHGRYHTALPIYFAPTAGQNKEYVIGPNVVWQIGPEDEKPGILEFHGTGLKSLEQSLVEKENQIAALGGRLISQAQAQASLSDNELRMKEANEASLLLNVVRVVDRSVTRLIRLWVQWHEGAARPRTDIKIALSKDFLLNHSGAREFRAIHSMYMDGILPIEVVYDYLVKSDVVPEEMTLEEFKSLLDNPDSFINQPDFEARKEGFADANARQKAKEDEAARASAEKLAKEQAAQTPSGDPPPPKDE